MKRFGLAMAVVTVVLSGGHAFSAPSTAEIETILKKSRIKNADVAIYAVSYPDGRVVANLNKDMLLNPASCMKLITSAVALKTFGPDYRFPTQFYIGKGETGYDLWVKGVGDPSLVIEMLGEAIHKMIQAGLPHQINNIYIDDTYFDDSNFPGRRKRNARAYNAKASAVALNHSSITVEVSPNGRPGQPVVIKTDAPGIVIHNLAKTGLKNTKKTLKVIKQKSAGEETFNIIGRLPLTSPAQRKYFSAADPAMHFGRALEGLLISSGIQVKGDISLAMVPRTAKLIFESKSAPLSDILKDMNKFSNNFMAEQITKAIGARLFGEPGSTENGVRAFGEYLTTLGRNNFYMENGSGLSHKNRVSAADIFAVLKDMYANRRLRAAFMDSLSVSGIDGTLKKWDSANMVGRLKAKTGSLNHVSSLAGFLPDGDNTILFSIFLNGRGINFISGRKVSQQIIESFIK